MARMIIDCPVCGTQNFVSVERRAVAEMPPLCWKCGEPLPAPAETGGTASESYCIENRAGRTGEKGNA